MSIDIYNILNLFVSSLSAIGTLLAVIVALYFARRDQKANLELEIGISESLDKKTMEIISDYRILNIEITNLRRRPLILTGLYLDGGFFKKKYHDLTEFEESTSATLPVKICDGEHVHFEIKLTDLIPFLYEWENGIRFPKVWIKSLKIGVKTSTKRVFESKIDKSIQRQILKLIPDRHEMKKSKAIIPIQKNI